jgi:hypothetical protein
MPSRALYEGGQQLLRAGEIVGNADVDEGAVTRRSQQLAAACQIRQDFALERARHIRDLVEQAATDKIYSGIDRLGTGTFRPEPADTTFRKLDPAIAGAFDATGQGGVKHPVGPAERGHQGEPVEVEIGIAIEHEKRFVEAGRGIHQGTGGAGGAWLDDDLDLEVAEALAVVSALDGLRLVAGQQQQAGQPETAGFVHEVVEKRPTADLQQRLRCFVGQASQAGTPAANEANRLRDVHRGAGIYAAILHRASLTQRNR